MSSRLSFSFASPEYRLTIALAGEHELERLAALLGRARARRGAAHGQASLEVLDARSFEVFSLMRGSLLVFASSKRRLTIALAGEHELERPATLLPTGTRTATCCRGDVSSCVIFFFTFLFFCSRACLSARCDCQSTFLNEAMTSNVSQRGDLTRSASIVRKFYRESRQPLCLDENAFFVLTLLKQRD